jgi:beta-galactosidase GanA
VPWGFHELEPGRIDLAGHTNSRRDLVGLLHLATALDLPCLLNFGPALQRGLLNDGLPLWLAAGDTALLAAAKRWYTALSQTLTPEQWPAGPIVAVQIGQMAHLATQTLRRYPGSQCGL